MTDTTARTGISINASFFVLAFMLLFFKPTIVVDGATQKGEWGDNFVSLAPGQHAIEIYFKYFFFKCGKASTTLNVGEGQTAGLRYRAPLFVILPGKLTAA